MPVLLGFLMKVAILALSLFAHSFAGDDFERISKQFHDSFSQPELQDKLQALEVLAGLRDPRGFSLLLEQFAEVALSLDDNEQDERSLNSEFERLQREVRFKERKQATQEDINVLEQRRLELELFLAEKYNPLRKDLEHDRRLKEALRNAALGVFQSLSPSQQKKLRSDLQKDVFGDASRTKGAQLELYAELGDADAPKLFFKRIRETLQERDALKGELPKKQAKFDQLARKLQQEAAKSGGYVPANLSQEYKALQAQISIVMGKIISTMRMERSLKRAASRSPSSLEESSQAKAVKYFADQAVKASKPLRYHAIEILGGVSHAQARFALRGILEEDSDQGARLAAIGALAEQGDVGSLTLLQAVLKQEEPWEIKAAVIRSFAFLRDKEAIPILIDTLERERGRLTDDCETVLHNLTGKTFHQNPSLWRKWWAENKESFEFPERVPLFQSVASLGSGDDSKTMVSFYGIKTNSKKILYILDVSGSMQWSLEGEDGEYPNEGEASRIQLAREELLRAVDAMDEGGRFNVIVFATDVAVWQKDLVPPNQGNIDKARKFLEDLDIAGGTNLYGALVAAFKHVGLETGRFSESPIDTIFLLSDGQPSEGEVTDPDKILDFIRERNRLAHIVIHTVGLSKGQDASLLRRVAEQNGGRFVER